MNQDTQKDEVKRLSALVTLKRLYSSKKTKNAVIAEFIYSIIVEENIVIPFSCSEMKSFLVERFGFSLPLGVVEQTLSQMDSISRTTKEENPNEIEYKANLQSIKKRVTSHERIKLEPLKNQFKKFCSENGYACDVAGFERDLCKFLLLDSLGLESPNREIMSLFICSVSSNTDSFELLNSIKEGAILYTGLNYDVLRQKTKIKLSLYLDTEVLFDLAGLNGKIYKDLVLDLFAQINSLRMQGNEIKVYYFPEIKKEIDSFYRKAERIVGGDDSDFCKIAMRSIVSGCNDPSDVQVKKADFFSMIENEFGIKKNKL